MSLLASLFPPTKNEPSPRIQRGNGSNAKHTYDMQNATTPIPELSEKDKARFWAKVDKRGTDECWPWRRAIAKSGYGVFGLYGKIKTSHRVSWRVCRGEIPAGISVLHHCDNRPCCNPAHLFLGTHDDNMADKIKKGRQASGVTHAEYYARGTDGGMTKLTEESVREIRSIYSTTGISQKRIAIRFGVDRTNISSIIRRKTWRHVT